MLDRAPSRPGIPREAAGPPDSRFAPLADIPERTYRRLVAKTEPGDRSSSRGRHPRHTAPRRCEQAAPPTATTNQPRLRNDAPYAAVNRLPHEFRADRKLWARILTEFNRQPCGSAAREMSSVRRLATCLVEADFTASRCPMVDRQATPASQSMDS